MEIQKQLISLPNHTIDDINKGSNNSLIEILSWNLQNPSKQRAQKQTEYLLNSTANVLILTELKTGVASEYIIGTLEANGFNLFFGVNLEKDDYFTIIATRGLTSKPLMSTSKLQPPQQRVVGIDVIFGLGALSIIGMYVPAHAGKFATPEKIMSKNNFHDQIIDVVNKYFRGGSYRLIIGGDLNIIEPKHIPSDNTYIQWEGFYKFFIENFMLDAFRLKKPNAIEHSWYSHQGGGLRLDHFFVDKRLGLSVVDCYYSHEPRENKLSDHSVMILKLFSK